MLVLSEKISTQKSGFVAIAVVVIFAIASFFLTRPANGTQTISSVSGLMTLQAAAKTAMPYDVAMANPQPTLIEFYADWCTTCQAMAATIETVHQQFSDDLNIVMLNIDEPQWQKQVESYKVSGVPHFVLLQKDLNVADTYIGRVPLQILASRIASLVS
ncbi:MAG: thioredoxin domain-containing protein [Limnothrix sp.]